MFPCFHALNIPQTKRGFTLSELLISLAVLGLISALTLPTIFDNVKKQQREALLSETRTILQNAWMDAVQNGELLGPSSQDVQTPFYKRLNASRTCTQGFTQGCVGRFEPSTPDTAAVLLPNGVGVMAWGVGNCGPTGSPDPTGNNACFLASIYIDLNGGAAPNTTTEDIAMLFGNRTDKVVPTSYFLPYGFKQLKPGEVLPNGVWGQLFNTKGGNWWG